MMHKKNSFYQVFYGALLGSLLCHLPLHAANEQDNNPAAMDADYDIDPTVSIKNGNFFRTFHDMYIPGSQDLKIQRTYNSRTEKKSIFGWGWGFEFANYLEPSSDGGIILYENGSGAENRFYPQTQPEAQVKERIGQIVAEAEKRGELSAQNKSSYIETLTKDVVFRESQWKRLFKSEELASKIPTGTVFQSNLFFYQTIQKTASGYQRNFIDSPQIEIYDQRGRLVEIKGAYKYHVKLTYAADGKIKEIVDHKNQKIMFSYDTHGLVTDISSSTGQKASYEYNAQEELIKSIDFEHNLYTYEYDSKNTHNMTKITGDKGQSIEVSYYDSGEYKDAVKRFKDYNKQSIEYTYKGSPSKEGTYKVTQLYKNAAGKKINEWQIAYQFKINAVGQIWTESVENISNGVTQSKNTYHEKCGGIIESVEKEIKKTYAYDNQCRLSQKVTPFEKTTLSYDKRFGKVEKISKQFIYNNQPAQGVDYEFTYNDQGDIKKARSSDGLGFSLGYDRFGRIILILQDESQMKFTYNENNQPTSLEMSNPKAQKSKKNILLTVEYDNAGKPKSISSNASRQKGLNAKSKKTPDDPSSEEVNQLMEEFDKVSALLNEAGVKI